MSVYVKKETCSKCDCQIMENLVRVESGEPIRIYVRCTECGTFVARYTLERYTSDKPYESLLRFHRKHGHSIHSRSRAQEVEAFSRDIENNFKETVDNPVCDLRIEEMIWKQRSRSD
jgi:hypothetical protein